MIEADDIKQIGEFLYEIPQTYREDMKVPARCYVDPILLEAALQDRCIDQLINTTTLPGIVRYSLAMPDIHQGYGFPIGGVVATQLPDGVISPGGVGYDINCGVRLLASQLDRDEIVPHLDQLATVLDANCPSGLGKGGNIKLGAGELDQILERGARWALKRGFADNSDLERTEEGGGFTGVDAAKVSERAKQRGKNQVGTLGSGNHFIEVGVVESIFDETAAQRMGLRIQQIVVQIHSGSRGLGHQVCSDYVKRFQKAIHKYGIQLVDRELVCAPLNSPDGQDYLAGMKAAANYAFNNRQVLAFHVRRSFEQVLAGKVKNHHLFQIYDVGHNMAKIEEHMLGGAQLVQLCVHRKGATRAYGPGMPDLPDAYRDLGQPVLVPGSMGTASWVLKGSQRAMEDTFASSCHGAGLSMSRAKAKKSIWGAELREALEADGIRVRAGSMAGLAEEAPAAYKDVDRVIEIMHGAGIATKVARLRPLAVVKG